MAFNFKEVMSKPERLAPGHRMCAGCGGTIAVRTVLRALHEGDKAVIGNADVVKLPLTVTVPQQLPANAPAKPGAFTEPVKPEFSITTVPPP